MGAKTRTLMSIEVVTDHDCGNYRIGEIDFLIHGALQQFLKTYGIEGRNDLLLKLDYLSHHVRKEWERIPDGLTQAKTQ